MSNIKENINNIISDIDQVIKFENKDIINENANTDGQSVSGMMGIFAGLLTKEKAKDLIDKDILEKFEDGFIHIHDFDYYLTGTTTCCQIPLGKMLEKGFKIGQCFMRSPKSINTALQLSAILIQANQNDQHGGQAYPNFDYDLAPYIKLTYNKHLDFLKEISYDKNKIEDKAWELTKKDTKEACEGFVHNANSMLSRSGMQVPFISVNFGLDTSKEGRLLSMSLLEAQIKGIGDNDTPLFPILVFKLKKGINMDKKDPNYDVYLKSLECLSKRLFPNYQFIDADFNLDGFDINNPNTHMATMGCRTRVYSNLFSENTVIGRGNLSFTTLNLPMIAKESLDMNIDFLEHLNEYMDLVIRQLLNRLDYQKDKLKSSYKTLYSGVWKDSDIDTNEKVEEILKHGTLSMGFLGLAESLKLLVGSHHGESDKAQELGIKIVKNMREKMDNASSQYNLNFSLLATPAESYSGKAVDKFRKKYGIINGVSEYDFFTNSSHIPVYYNISIKNKIKKEAPYHKYENAGHILYVEVDGDMSKNIMALDDIIKEMAKHNTGYGSINHPIDSCKDCNYQAIIKDSCPKCDSYNIMRIRRITGYLVGDLDKWNKGKLSELKNRVIHGKN